MLALPSREALRRALGGAASASSSQANRTAAVSVVIHEADAALSILLIERAQRATDPWSGHMALPGGHYEPHDVDLRATAERETREEVGLDLTLVDLLGSLPERPPAHTTELSIQPFVYWLFTRPELRLNHEVSAAIWVPLAPLARGEHRAEYVFKDKIFPAWDIDGRIVWGFTYRVLAELLSALSSQS
ncbi:MAG TPA: CoA pyrophosphatase [Polyangiaceae bacterium]